MNNQTLAPQGFRGPRNLRPLTKREEVELQIGLTEHKIDLLLDELCEDSAALRAVHDGTADDNGWTEDERARFVADAQDKLTGMLAELDGLWAEWALLVQAETAAA